MQEKHRFVNENHLKPVFYKEKLPIDPLLTFQPKSAPINLSSQPKSIYQNQEIRKIRQISNKAYFQELTRKNQKVTALNNFSVISSASFPTKSQESGRLYLKSDAKKEKPNKKEFIESMNNSYYETGKFQQEKFKDHEIESVKVLNLDEKDFLTPQKEMVKINEDIIQVKTPTFKSSTEDKRENFRYLQNFSEKKQVFGVSAGKNNSFLIPIYLDPQLSRENSSNKIKKLHDIKQEKISTDHHNSEFKYQNDTESKKSLVGSSISTDFQILSPSHANDKSFFKNYANQNQIQLNEPDRKSKSPFNKRREHPKIKIRKGGLPKDVFIYKNK